MVESLPAVRRRIESDLCKFFLNTVHNMRVNMRINLRSLESTSTEVKGIMLRPKHQTRYTYRLALVVSSLDILLWSLTSLESPFWTKKEVGELFEEEFKEEGFVEEASSGLEDRLEEDVDCSMTAVVEDEVPASVLSLLLRLGSG